jgi:four helix bundle protein
MQPYEKLHAWQACQEFFVAVHRISRSWPAEERYCLTAQLRRAPLSAGANIAEGVPKRSPKDSARFLGMAVSSLSEAGHHLRAAQAVGVAKDAQFQHLEPLREKAARLTFGLFEATRRGLKSTVDSRQ